MTKRNRDERLSEEETSLIIMETRKNEPKKRNFPDEIQVGSKHRRSSRSRKGKRARESPPTQDADPATPLGTQIPCRQHQNATTTPLTATGEMMSSRNSLATIHSVITGGSQQPPPQPPATPPPLPSQIVKILYIGSESATRRKWIANLVHRGECHVEAVTSPPTTPMKQNANGQDDRGKPTFALDYLRKDYTFHSATTGEETAVRMQFLHLDGDIPSDTPPEDSWNATRRKIDSALFVLDLRQAVALWDANQLESHLERWRNLVTQWTHHSVPIHLMLVNVSSCEQQDEISSPRAQQHQLQHPMSAARLLRIGAAMATACRLARFHSWFLLGSEASSSDMSLAGLDSVDAVLQCLAEQAAASKSDSSSVAQRTRSPKAPYASPTNSKEEPPNGRQVLKDGNGATPAPSSTLHDSSQKKGHEATAKTNFNGEAATSGKKNER